MIHLPKLMLGIVIYESLALGAIHFFRRELMHLVVPKNIKQKRSFELKKIKRHKTYIQITLQIKTYMLNRGYIHAYDLHACKCINVLNKVTAKCGVSQTNILSLWSILKFPRYGNLARASPLKITV